MTVVQRFSWIRETRVYWVLREDFSALLFNWQITIPLLVLIFVAALLQHKSFRRVGHRALLLLLPLAIPVLIIHCHVIREVEVAGDPSWLDSAVGVLLLFYAALSGFVIYRLSGFGRVSV